MFNLNNLTLDELSLVDRPANPAAMVSLFKRDNGENMTDINKQLEEAQAEITKNAAEVERLRSENERLTKGLIDNDFVVKADVIEKKAPEAQIEVSGEMINKSDIPAPVLKALEEAAIEKAEAEVAKAAEELAPNLDPAVARVLIKADTSEEFVAFVKSADALFADKMEEAGDTSVDVDLLSAEDKVDAMVKNHMKEEGIAKAYAAIAKTEAGKALINETYKKD
jgi:hypothetical protein